MSGPPARRRLSIVGSIVALTALAVAVPVAAQTQPGVDSGAELAFSFLTNVVGAVIGTLILGGGLILLAPEYTERTTDRIENEPLETFLYGLGISIAAVVVMFLLAITIIGILAVIPMAIALAIVGQLGYLAVGRSVSDEWAVVLLVALVVAAVAGGVPILGGLLGFVLSSMGVGAAYFDYKEDGGTGGSSTSSTSPPGSRGGIDTSGSHRDSERQQEVDEAWGSSNDEWGSDAADDSGWSSDETDDSAWESDETADESQWDTRDDTDTSDEPSWSVGEEDDTDR
jgi:hypothetical protein